MLRKNNLDRLKTIDRCTVSCQTQQFLLYLAMEQKLQSVYGEYRTLMNKYKQAMQMIQFLQHKNSYLETSLFDISIIYNNKMASSNLRRIQQIKNLEQTITKQSKELQNLHQISVIHKQYSHNITKSVYQEEQGKPQTDVVVSKSKSESINTLRQKHIDEPQTKYQEIGVGPSHEQCKSQISLTQSKNEFLYQLSPPNVLVQRKQKVNCETQRYQDQKNVLFYQKSATYRHSPKNKKPSSKKKSSINKENINYEKLVKIEAQLKMKQFMSKFKINGNLQQQFAQDQNMFCEQLDMLKFIEGQQGNRALRNMR